MRRSLPIAGRDDGAKVNENGKDGSRVPPYSLFLSRSVPCASSQIVVALSNSLKKKKERKEKILLRVIQKFRKEKYYTVKIIVHV